MTTHHVLVRGLGTALAFALGAGGVTYAVTSGGSDSRQALVATQGLPARERTVLPTQPAGPWASDGSGGSDSAQSRATDATKAQEKGLVYLTSSVSGGTSAGTGMVLTDDGDVVTNYHVVEGATSITAQVVSTGRTYRATVVGYDASDDVALLELTDASGLTTVTTDPQGDVQVGDAVTGVGNAYGDGGAASAAAGTVSALHQSISVASESGQGAEQLSDLIQVDADIIAGDSGGALYDEEGEVIGMNTAASTGTQEVTGYAIPIANVLRIVDQIDSGVASDGVQIADDSATQTAGVLVDGVVNGSAAAAAGLTEGSIITAFDGGAATSAEALASAVAEHAVGDSVSITWTSSDGTPHEATVTLRSAGTS